MKKTTKTEPAQNTVYDDDAVRKSTFYIEYTELGNGKTRIHRISNGFDAIELLGLLDFTRGEIVEQMRGVFKPDIIKREVVE